VTGCLVQRYGADLQKELPEVDLFTGTDGFQEIDALIRRAAHDPEALLDLRPAKFFNGQLLGPALVHAVLQVISEDHRRL